MHLNSVSLARGSVAREIRQATETVLFWYPGVECKSFELLRIEPTITTLIGPVLQLSSCRLQMKTVVLCINFPTPHMVAPRSYAK